MPQISLDDIESTTLNALVRHGASEEVAAQVAHAVRTAECRGNKICGLYYVAVSYTHLTLPTIYSV